MYEYLNGTKVGSNLAELLVYANSVTNELFGLVITVAFFAVVLIASLMFQLRLTGRIRPETSLMASSFATLGWATILEMYSGILSPVYFFFIIGITILSILLVALSSD
jgi:tetrahydromethanopterin S-methyltransferase subunit B